MSGTIHHARTFTHAETAHVVRVRLGLNWPRQDPREFRRLRSSGRTYSVEQCVLDEGASQPDGA